MGATFDQALREFGRRGRRAPAAVDQVVEQKRPPVPTRGIWVHLGCGGRLVRLRGLERPVCLRCNREVRR